jgi:hypothetical protein
MMFKVADAGRCALGLLSLALCGSVPGSQAQAPKGGLVAHWKLDDGKGSEKAADASGRGNDGKLSGGPAWTPGKCAGALKLDGVDDHVEASSPELGKLVQGSYSIVAWFRPEVAPAGKDSENNANFGVVLNAGTYDGIYYTNERQFIMGHKIGGEAWCGAGTWDSAFDPKTYYHVAGVVDREARSVRIYVDGELEGDAEWEGDGEAPADADTWRLGIGTPGVREWGWPAKAEIDDVRLYDRALTDDEVIALFESTDVSPEK